MSGYHIKNLSPLIHRRLQIASAILGMHQKDFLIEAIEEKIARSSIPEDAFPKSLDTKHEEETVI